MIKVKETGWENVDWIHLAQDRDQWWAVVNMVMKFQVPQKAGISTHQLSNYSC
jgi:hypothetical protein